MNAASDGFLVVLIDALACPYLVAMPFLKGLAAKGKAYCVKPAPGFRGVEPILNGQWTSEGEVPFRFRLNPGSGDTPAFLVVGDVLFPPALNRVWRLLVSRLMRRSYPHLVPSRLLGEFTLSTGTAQVPKAIEKWEENGLSVWWYTRDSKWEHKKSLTARVYRKLYRHRMLMEAMENLRAGKDVVYLEFSTELDGVGHRYGPEAPQTSYVAEKINRDLEMWVAEARKARPDISIAVIGDHGMSRVDCEFALEENLQIGGFENGRDYLGIWNSNFGQIWSLGGSPSDLADTLRRYEHLHVLSVEERQRWFGADLSYGELIVACEEGCILRPNHFQGNKKVKGMHGYLNATSPASRALCVFAGKGFRHLDETQVAMPDLFPLLAFPRS